MRFIVPQLALYTTGGGVLLRGTLVGTPATNTARPALGTVLTSVTGTTGASILRIRPVPRANAFRARNARTFAFFVFLVSDGPRHADADAGRAVSAGAVFFGANSHTGHAPTGMGEAIVEENGVRRPSFFGYSASAPVVLLPLFVLVTLLFF